MNVSATTRADQIRVNLERARWVVGGLSDTFVLVNLPAFKTYLIRDGKNVWETRAQVGKAGAADADVPRPTCATSSSTPTGPCRRRSSRRTCSPPMRKGENAIAKKKLTIVDRQGEARHPRTSIDWATARRATFPYTLRQPPGRGQRARARQVHLPERARYLPARHAEPGAVQCRRAHVQLGVHPGRESARRWRRCSSKGRTTGTARRIQEVVDAGTTQTVLLEAAAAGADRVLDRERRRLG